MFGIENFTAIINPPELGILSISSTKDEPLVVTDEAGNKSIDIRPMMNITLSVDHRVIDGLLASQVVTEVKRLLEHPISLMESYLKEKLAGCRAEKILLINKTDSGREKKAEIMKNAVSDMFDKCISASLKEERWKI